jgi:hypothetical protein
MNNVNPPSSFTAHILLHTYTQARSQSSAERGFGISASQHVNTLRLTPHLVITSACQPAAAGEFQADMWNRQVHIPVYKLLGARNPCPFPPPFNPASLPSFPRKRESTAPGSSHLQERFTGLSIKYNGPAARADESRGGAWKAPVLMAPAVHASSGCGPP